MEDMKSIYIYIFHFIKLKMYIEHKTLEAQLQNNRQSLFSYVVCSGIVSVYNNINSLLRDSSL